MMANDVKNHSLAKNKRFRFQDLACSGYGIISGVVAAILEAFVWASAKNARAVAIEEAHAT